MSSTEPATGETRPDAPALAQEEFDARRALADKDAELRRAYAGWAATGASEDTLRALVASVIDEMRKPQAVNCELHRVWANQLEAALTGTVSPK